MRRHGDEGGVAPASGADIRHAYQPHHGRGVSA